MAILLKIYSGKHLKNNNNKKGISTVGANMLEMHCKHKRVFEGGNRVRNQRRDREKERKRGGGGKGRRFEAKNYLHGPFRVLSLLFSLKFVYHFILL